MPHYSLPLIHGFDPHAHQLASPSIPLIDRGTSWHDTEHDYTKPHQTTETNASYICSGVCEFLRIAFSLLVPLSLRYLIDYVERAELAALAAAATVTGAGEEATWEWENSTAEGGGGGIPNQGRPDRCRIVSNRLIRLINAKRRVERHVE